MSFSFAEMPSCDLSRTNHGNFRHFSWMSWAFRAVSGSLSISLALAAPGLSWRDKAEWIAIQEEIRKMSGRVKQSPNKIFIGLRIILIHSRCLVFRVFPTSVTFVLWRILNKTSAEICLFSEWRWGGGYRCFPRRANVACAKTQRVLRLYRRRQKREKCVIQTQICFFHTISH